MIKLVLDAFAQVVADVNQRDAARIERLEKAWSEANSNIPPKMDSQGRLHAPCDGYMLPEMGVDYIANYDERVFAKGQYLPIPLSGDDYLDYKRFDRASKLADKYQPRDKIKVDESLADEIIGELKDNLYIQFGKGKSWEVNNVSVCYLYLTSYSKSILNQFVGAIKDAIENKDRQIYTGEGISGRVRVKGTVLRVIVEDSHQSGYYNIEFVRKLMIRLDNDSICYGSEPSNIRVESGDVVEFTASFEKSEKVSHQSYYKRPFKMVKIESIN